MGVQGLWDLLGVTGRRVEVEALGNRRVAVDASIWIVQFIKAMRQSDGSVMANAHLLGMFRRLCKLIFMKVKPVIVFDGAAPVLKRKTLQNRRKQRQKGETQLKKIAERILLNQLRAQAIGVSKKPSESEKAAPAAQQAKKFDFSNPNRPKDTQADIAAPTAPQGAGNAVIGTPEDVAAEREGKETSVEIPAEREQRQGSLRGQLLGNASGGAGGSKGQNSVRNAEDSNKARNSEVVGKQQAVAAKNNRQIARADDADYEVPTEEEDDEEDDEDSGEEVEGLGKRVAVRLPAGADYEEMKEQIAALPVLMQYETLQNLKEDRRATNRSVFASVRNSPLAYSQLQIRNYLKTTSINGHIEAVRAKLAGSHVLVTEDGKQVPAKRIISDDTTEFILYQKSTPAPADKPKGMPKYLPSSSGGSSLVGQQGGFVRGHTLSMAKRPQVDAVALAAAQRSLLEGESEEEEEEAGCGGAKGERVQQQGAKVEVVDDDDEEMEDVAEVSKGRGEEEGAKQEGESDVSVEMEEVIQTEKGGEGAKAMEEEEEDEMEDVAVDAAGEDLFAGVFEEKAPAAAGPKAEEEQGGVEVRVGSDKGKGKGKGKEAKIQPMEEAAGAGQAHGERRSAGAGGGRAGSAVVDLSEEEQLRLAISMSLSAAVEQAASSSVGDAGASSSVGNAGASSIVGNAGASSSVDRGDGGASSSASAAGRSAKRRQDEAQEEEEEEVEEEEKVVISEDEAQPLGEQGRSGDGDGGSEDGERPPMSMKERDRRSASAARAPRRHVEMVNACAICDDPDSEGVLVCSECGYAGHSWCLYGEDEKEEEEEAVTRGESWLCGGCQWKAQGAAPENGAPADAGSADKHEEAEASAVPRRPVSPEKEGGASGSAWNGAERVGLDTSQVAARRARRKGQRLGESMEVGEAGEDEWGAEEEVEERVRRAMSEGRKTKLNPKQILQQAGYDYSGGMLVQKRGSSQGGSHGGSAQPSPSPSALLPPTKAVPKMVQPVKPAAQAGAAAKSSAPGGRGPAAKSRGEVEVKEADRQALAELLEGEKASLTAAKQKLQKATETVTDQMMVEVQELLELFGVPYVLSPTEAEAQCAALEELRLVDGVVTDDCDVFLFGGRNVFKNIFSDNKFVEWYMMDSIESELSLDRERLILLALLLGSDYTEGIRGIGIVNAVETLRAFPSPEALREFRNWVYSATAYDFAPGCLDPALLHARRQFARSHAKARKNWEVSSEFPSQAVVEAYRRPTVDRSSEAFEWGEPDVAGLEGFCRDKFGWEAAYTRQVLRPVLEAHRTRLVQTRVDQYSSFYKRAARIKSARVKKVVVELNRGLVAPDMMADGEVLTKEFLEAEAEAEAEAERRRRKGGGRKKRGQDGEQAAKAGTTRAGRGKKGKGGMKGGGEEKEETEEKEEEEIDLEDDEEFLAALQMSKEAGEEEHAGQHRADDGGVDEEGGAGKEEEDEEEEEDVELEELEEFQAALRMSMGAENDGDEEGASDSAEAAGGGGVRAHGRGAGNRKGGQGAARKRAANAEGGGKQKRRRTLSAEGPAGLNERRDEPRAQNGESDAARESDGDDDDDESWELGEDYQAALALSKGVTSAPTKSGSSAGDRPDRGGVESEDDELQAALTMSLET